MSNRSISNVAYLCAVLMAGVALAVGVASTLPPFIVWVLAIMPVGMVILGVIVERMPEVPYE